MKEEDIDFLMSIQGLEQPEFDNACLERENKKLENEIERLNSIIEKLEQENAVLKTQVVNKDKYSYGIRIGSDKK